MIGTTINDVEIVGFNIHKEKEGSLIPVETGKEVSFDIKRVFYVF